MGYGFGCGCSAGLVDRLIGGAYDQVKLVSENIDYIKHVSSNLASVYRVYASAAQIDLLAANISVLDGLAVSSVLSSAVAVSHTGDLAEAQLASIDIPVLLTKSAIEIEALFSLTGSLDSKTLRARLGADIATGTMFASHLQTPEGLVLVKATIQNRGALNSQLAYCETSEPALTSNTGAVDTSVATTLFLTGQLANAADSVTLERYRVNVVQLG